ncbi:MAG: serine/threonine-protein kinase, partial [Anaerolineales bacterium]|nr:serine/threonine-protein kinase [Anaerolineales bacterium]
MKRRIGRGGMADVYLGEHSTLGHRVAVKVLHAHLLEDEEHQRRFHAEAKAVAALRHPHIVQVYDFQLVDDRPLIIMELLEGPSLSDYMTPVHRGGRRLPLAHAVKIVSQIGDALDHAHAQGIVHRDVKPANIVLRSPSAIIQPDQDLPDDVTAVLTDFGVARLANASTATATGTLLGTPAYMAPEQALGEKVGPRADIYALGVVLYELLTGGLPFGSQDTTPAAVLFKHVHEHPRPLPEELGQLQAVVSRALAKRPEERYMTAGDFVVDLKRAAKGKGPEPITMKGKRPRAVQQQVSAGEEAPDRRWILWAGGLAGL